MITNVFVGILILSSIYLMLNTINPDLLSVELNVENVEIVGEVKDRSQDFQFVEAINAIDTQSINVPAGGFKDPTFLAYMTHQQGRTGAAIILWAAEKSINFPFPTNNPFNKKRELLDKIAQRNMPNNYFGGKTLTPKTFAEWWYKKVQATKQKTGSIPAKHVQALQAVSKATGVDLQMLKTMCYIESYACTKADARNGKYKGLFQMGDGEFKKYGPKGKNGNIYDPYENAYAAAKYMQENVDYIQSKADVIFNN